MPSFPYGPLPSFIATSTLTTEMEPNDQNCAGSACDVPTNNPKPPTIPPVSTVDINTPDFQKSGISEPQLVKGHRTRRMAPKTKKDIISSVFAGLYDDLDPEQTPVLAFPVQDTPEGGCEATSGATIVVGVPEAMPIHLTSTAGSDKSTITTILNEMKGLNTKDVNMMDSSAAQDDFVLRAEWVGSSQFYDSSCIYMQKAGQLEGVISYREALVHDLESVPYDPELHLRLANVDITLGFTDIAAGNSYRALLLVEAGKNIKSSDASLLPFLGEAVRKQMGYKLQTTSKFIISDELDTVYGTAYKVLLVALLGCAAFWDGIALATKALKRFPADDEIKQLMKSHTHGYLDQVKELRESLPNHKDKQFVLSRMGKIYTKKYPWMSNSLFVRTSRDVRQFNIGQFHDFGIAEVQRAFYGDMDRSPINEGQDVGPLGVFATRDIDAGEIVLADITSTGISNIPPSRLEYCDSCHCNLLPVHQPVKIHRPNCCTGVAYCSKTCMKTATNGYHQILCGKNIDWVYKHNEMTEIGMNQDWLPIMFARMIAVVLTDDLKNNGWNATTAKNLRSPLEHHALARMTANYTIPETQLPDSLSYWKFNNSVVKPTKALMQLGINIFSNPNYSQEMIQTVYWRFDNNANVSDNSHLLAPNPPDSAIVRNINISPHYVFFNHSCEPNIDWRGSQARTTSKEVPGMFEDMSLDALTGNDFRLRPGSSTVICTANRAIKKGEQLFISYIGAPTGLRTEGDENGAKDRRAKRLNLSKWFENGCGCRICEKENKEVREEGTEPKEKEDNGGVEMMRTNDFEKKILD